METITESGKTRIVIIPVIAHPSLVVSKMVWLGPDNLPTNITTSAVLQLSGVIYQHRVISIISGLEDEKLGENKLLYERKFLTSVFIRKEGKISTYTKLYIEITYKEIKLMISSTKFKKKIYSCYLKPVL